MSRFHFRYLPRDTHWGVLTILATNAGCATGKGVLGSIVQMWGNNDGTDNYTTVYIHMTR